MKIGEVSSTINSYQGQGSSAKTAPTQSVNSSAETNPQPKVVETIDAELKNKKSDAEVEEKNTNGQMTPSLKDAVEKINSANSNAEAVFGIHEGTNRVTIKMVDKETHKVIKEFPADKTLDLIAKAWELAGIMVDEKR
ncbi:MAG: flagellar protein FlaG [Pseudobutyrivibrio sp.]|nr:flagellar protein FlaG [Pseudobutyrivibrio sp.]